MPISDYIKKIKGLHQSGRATEHSYRGALQELIEIIVEDVQVEMTT